MSKRNTLFVKRGLDLVISSLLLIILSPFLLIISLFVLIFLGRPIIFKQKRPGLMAKPFKIYKFRSMLNKVDTEGNLLPDNQRITPFGCFMRNSSIDELPELLNILKGDLSFVGPRPLIFKYLPYYTPREMKRHTVRPGLTGLAQINGRNFTDWDKRLELDVQYVENMSFWLDLKIIFKTIIKVLFREGTGLQVVPDLDIQRKK